MPNEEQRIDPVEGMTGPQLHALLKGMAGEGVHIAEPRPREAVAWNLIRNDIREKSGLKLYILPLSDAPAENPAAHESAQNNATGYTGSHYTVVCIIPGLGVGQDKLIGFDSNSNRCQDLPYVHEKLTAAELPNEIGRPSRPLDISNEHIIDASSRHQSPAECGHEVYEFSRFLKENIDRLAGLKAADGPNLAERAHDNYNRVHANRPDIASKNRHYEALLNPVQQIDEQRKILEKLVGEHTFEAELSQKKAKDVEETSIANDKAKRKRPFDTINATLDNLNSGIQEIDLSSWDKTLLSVLSVLFGVAKAILGIVEAGTKTYGEIKTLDDKIKSGQATAEKVDRLAETIYSKVEQGLQQNLFSEKTKQYIVDQNLIRPEHKAEWIARYNLPEPTPEVQEGKAARIAKIKPEESLKDKGVSVAEGNAHQKPSHTEQVKKQQESPRAKL